MACVFGWFSISHLFYGDSVSSVIDSYRSQKNNGLKIFTFVDSVKVTQVELYIKFVQSCVFLVAVQSWWECSWQRVFSFITVPGRVLWECYVFIWVKKRGTHHNPCKQTHAFPTVRVWYHVPVANGEEGNRDEPHGSQEVTGHFLFVMIPEVTKISRSRIHTVSKAAHSGLNVSMLENDVVPCESNRGGEWRRWRWWRLRGEEEEKIMTRDVTPVLWSQFGRLAKKKKPQKFILRNKNEGTICIYKINFYSSSFCNFDLREFNEETCLMGGNSNWQNSFSNEIDEMMPNWKSKTTEHVLHVLCISI